MNERLIQKRMPRHYSFKFLAELNKRKNEKRKKTNRRIFK